MGFTTPAIASFKMELMKVHRPIPLSNQHVRQGNMGGHHQFVHRRLKEMEGHHFFRLDPNGGFESVGEIEDSWTPAEIEVALPRVRDLATDPARGTKLSDMGLEEAAVALTAEHLDVFSRLTRETSGGAEFRDENGVSWDVKSPFSPPPEQGWSLSPEHHLDRVRKDFDQGDHVILNLTRVNSEDRNATMSLFQQALTVQEREQILFLSDYLVA